MGGGPATGDAQSHPEVDVSPLELDLALGCPLQCQGPPSCPQTSYPPVVPVTASEASVNSVVLVWDELVPIPGDAGNMFDTLEVTILCSLHHTPLHPAA